MSLVARQTRPGRLWLLAVFLAIAVAFVASLRPEMVNPGGFAQWSRFWASALEPRIDSAFLQLTARAALTTMSFAVIGTGLAIAIGLVGGIFISDTWWEGHGRRSRFGWRIARGVFVLPRGIHEAIWGLVFVLLLGRDPLVGVLAIAIPFGAITAKVFADIVDDVPHAAYDAIRTAGAGRLAAIVYALLPTCRGDMVSYSFYRFECAIRASVILGIVGAGGLGFELMLSFQSLRYDEMWTMIVAIVLLSAGADLWSSRLRTRPTARLYRFTLIASLLLLVLSALRLDIAGSRVFDVGFSEGLARLTSDFWPPRLPAGGMAELASASLSTLQMSILAMAFAAGLGVIFAFGSARTGGAVRRGLNTMVRGTLLLIRSIPPPVWALILLFLLFPGPIPGALALGIYTLGILARLMAESIENLDAAPRSALDASGASAASAFLYSTLPQAAPRLVSLSMYRWEVTIRETVIVGLVGAGGLGRLLAEQNAAFAHSRMLTTILAYVALSLFVDFTSAAVRRSSR